MNKKALIEIDYFRIRDEIAEFCVSEEGKNFLLEREPSNKNSEIERLKNLSREWSRYLSASHSSPILFWEPIGYLFAIIKTRGTTLSLEQVYAIGQFLQSLKKVQESIENHKLELNLKFLPEEISNLPNLEEAEKKIFRIITTDGQLRDLPEITAIRKQIANLNSKIKNIMQSFTSDQKFSSVLESSVPVLRNGRQVLAVKASLQNRIEGIIHEVSQTAQTVYIEPEEAVRCSNELIQKQNELQQVIKRILTELTQSLQVFLPDFKKSLPIMKLLDSTLASAKWGLKNDCTYAIFSNEEPPLLLKARHPLLGDKAVPIDIRFMIDKRVLIITGPNTGGKTVSLKTFALLSMLNQSGFPIPAGEGTRLPVFSDLYVDIGDDQSLDQNLSTFSGHMKNLALAVKSANSTSLILLDELGSGTDPQEGSAIAMAVLDELIKKKSFVLVTTHQGVLKNYGYTNSSCVNASVEFDANTLSPSYRLLMGVPGESHALDIAKKNGFPLEIIKQAENYIATEQTDVSSLIRGLNRKHVELNKIQKKAESEAKSLEEKSLKLKEKEIYLRKKEHELKAGKQQELNDFLIHSRRQLENLVRTLKEGEVTREKTLSVKKYISDLEKNTDKFQEKYELEEEKIILAEENFNQTLKKQNHPPSNKKTKKRMSNSEALKNAVPIIQANFEKSSDLNHNENTQKICEGAIVLAKSTGIEGTVISKVKKDFWQVQFGSVKMQVREKDLILTKKNQQNLKPSVSVELISQNHDSVIEKDSSPVFELRLLGMRSSEAIKALEKQIDLCVLHNLQSFSIIHGKGEGILQQEVTDYLSHCPVVCDFGFASADDGGTGKTYVKIGNKK